MLIYQLLKIRNINPNITKIYFHLLFHFNGNYFVYFPSINLW